MHLSRSLLLFAVGTDDRYCYIRLLHELQRRTPEAQACERGGKQALQALLLLAATNNALAVGHGLGGISNPAARGFQIPAPLPITSILCFVCHPGQYPYPSSLAFVLLATNTSKLHTLAEGGRNLGRYIPIKKKINSFFLIIFLI